MKHKIYLDCTHTYNSGLNTGIQRVVKNICKNIPEVSKKLDLEIVSVVLKEQRYYRFTDFPEINNTNNKLKTKLKYFYIKVRELLPNFISNYLHSPSLTTRLNKLTDKVLFHKSIADDNIVNIEKEDILFLIDTTWLNNNYTLLEELKTKKVKIMVLIYDIIPITHHQFCTQDLTNSLSHWYKNILPYIDSYIAISHAVKDEVYHYIETNYNKEIRYKNFDAFHLGSDFNLRSIDNISISDDFKKIFSSCDTYLTVSTIEPRKNHTYILDTFESLWEQGIDVKYVMIGKIGWESDEFIQRVKTHKEFNKKLFLLTEVNDMELVYAYKNSKSLVFASYTEGFGLPIIESLHHNLQVLCSDIQVHREIGKEFVTYFDLDDKDSLLSIIKTDDFNKNLKEFKSWSWKESTEDLMQKVLKQWQVIESET